MADLMILNLNVALLFTDYYGGDAMTALYYMTIKMVKK